MEYKVLSDVEHIIKRPGMYVGDIKNKLLSRFILNNEKKSMEYLDINYSQGILKLFDEVLVNASDETQRNKVNYIKINITNEYIEVKNDTNKSIPIEKQNDLYIPEIIFGMLRSGSNFNDDIDRTTGGINGLGVKLVNIFSSEFYVEISSGNTLYKQTWRDNMKEKNKANIKKSKKKLKEQYVLIRFYPDFEKFDTNKITENLKLLLYKRCYDIATFVSINKTKVYINEELIKIKNFKEYIELYLVSDEKYIYKKFNDRFELGLTLSKGDSLEIVSLVNGIDVFDGGEHINYIIHQINKYIQNKLKKDEKITLNSLKNKIFIFVNCLITNPSFSSQSKEKLITKIKDSGTNFILDETTLKKIYNLLKKSIKDELEFNNLKLLTKTNSKRRRLNIINLADAKYAGTKKSNEAILIITEGLSAMSLALSGIGSLKNGINVYGCYPLKGKVLNVRGASIKQLINNKEINELIQILGLKHDTDYSIDNNYKKLRYGSLLIFTDQDYDGFHIKGLIINLFHYFWPELLHRNDFMKFFITPICLVTKGKNKKRFYTLTEYNKYKINNTNIKTKYLKGLGSSTKEDAKFYFQNKNINEHIKYLKYDDETDDNNIKKAFDKKLANLRKKWITEFNIEDCIIYKEKYITYSDFIDRELIQFSIDDNKRSIPNIMDGFKESQRKIIFACFKKNLINEIKVSQLSGYISLITDYHHGEASLNKAIINLAQDYPCSNNLNLLLPCGQFGSRLENGNDSAAERYIFTKLNPITNYIYKKYDNYILEYNISDNNEIEPKYYCPIIPMVLINGCRGIGTGYSTYIPPFNPKDIIKIINKILKHKIDDSKKKLSYSLPKPYFKGWKGKIIKNKDGNYIAHPNIEQINKTKYKILDIPPEKSINQYKVILEKLLDNKIIKDYQSNCTDNYIEFIVEINKKVPESDNGYNELYKLLKLEYIINMNNMVLFNKNYNKLEKYSNIGDIINSFINNRIEYYIKRKDYLLNQFSNEYKILSNKYKFILSIINDKINIYKKKKNIIFQILEDNKFDKINNKYDYLIEMKIHNFSEEKLKELKKLIKNKQTEYKFIKEKSPEELWVLDINELNNNL